MATYAFSDLHAQYDLWTQIKEYIKPKDKVYCLGDCVDRGNVGLEILNEVMDTPNIILLRGNHEDFISSIGSKIMHYDSYEDIYWMSPDLYLWEANGAEKTIKAFYELSKEKRIELINKIKRLPTHAEYVSSNGNIIYLCHAGRQPDTEEIENTHESDIIPTNNYIWDRYHLMQPHWTGKDNEYCVHGHTPIEYMYYYSNPKFDPPSSKFEMYRYCDNHKINIDLGSFDTHYACLLNLDTFEPIYFKDRTLSKEEWEIINNEVE